MVFNFYLACWCEVALLGKIITIVGSRCETLPHASGTTVAYPKASLQSCKAHVKPLQLSRQTFNSFSSLIHMNFI